MIFKLIFSTFIAVCLYCALFWGPRIIIFIDSFFNIIINREPKFLGYFIREQIDGCTHLVESIDIIARYSDGEFEIVNRLRSPGYIRLKKDSGPLPKYFKSYRVGLNVGVLDKHRVSKWTKINYYI